MNAIQKSKTATDVSTNLAAGTASTERSTMLMANQKKLANVQNVYLGFVKLPVLETSL